MQDLETNTGMPKRAYIARY